MRAYRVASSMIAPPLTPHLFLPNITIITNNYWDIPPRFGQAITIAVRHERDSYVQLSTVASSYITLRYISKISIGPKELKG